VRCRPRTRCVWCCRDPASVDELRAELEEALLLGAERQLQVGTDRVEILVDLLAALADAAQGERGGSNSEGSWKLKRAGRVISRTLTLPVAERNSRSSRTGVCSCAWHMCS
jgi:hypothetical protein